MITTLEGLQLVELKEVQLHKDKMLQYAEKTEKFKMLKSVNYTHIKA